MGFSFRQIAGFPADDRYAAVALCSGGTVQGRIVASDLDGRVTLLTPAGRITGRPVAAAAKSRSLLREIFDRGAR